jgi:hypothetical protein
MHYLPPRSAPACIGLQLRSVWSGRESQEGSAIWRWRSLLDRISARPARLLVPIQRSCLRGEQSVTSVGLKVDIRQVRPALNLIALESQQTPATMVDRRMPARSERGPRAAGMELS